MRQSWSFNSLESHCFFKAFVAFLEVGSKIPDAHAIAIRTHTFEMQNKRRDIAQIRPEGISIMPVAPAGSDEELFIWLVTEELERLERLQDNTIALDCQHPVALHMESLRRWRERELEG